MTKVIGVQFKSGGKVYSFAPNGEHINIGDYVIVETAHGIECGTVARACREVPDEGVHSPLKPILRKATPQDMSILEENRRREKEAFPICKQKIEKHGLDMRLVDVELNFDRKKMLFYFISDERVDFRELVRDLASTFRTRIELRQIGVRDEAKMLGGFGPCGRPFCCSSYMTDFHPVSMKMAKEQGLSLNPTKISGTCGRLMCCLQYEQNAYEDLLRHTPKVGTAVETQEGRGVITSVQLLTGKLKVQLETEDGTTLAEYSLSDVVPLKKDGTPMYPLPKKKPAEPVVDEVGEQRTPEPKQNSSQKQNGNGKRNNNNNRNRRRSRPRKPKQES